MKTFFKQLFCRHVPDLKNHGIWGYADLFGFYDRRILHCTKCDKYYPSQKEGGYYDNDKRFKTDK